MDGFKTAEEIARSLATELLKLKPDSALIAVVKDGVMTGLVVGDDDNLNLRLNAYLGFIVTNRIAGSKTSSPSLENLSVEEMVRALEHVYLESGMSVPDNGRFSYITAQLAVQRKLVSQDLQVLRDLYSTYLGA